MTELSAIEKLKAARAQAGIPPAAPAAAPNPAPAPAVVADTSTPVEVIQVTSEVIAAPAAPADPAEAAHALTLVSSDDASAADAVLAMFGGNNTNAPVYSLAALNDETDDGGVKHELNFASLRKGNWEAYKKTPPEILEYLPAGNRPFRGVYLGVRVGLQAWPGASTPNGGGRPPLWSAVIPTPIGHKSSADLFRVAKQIASQIQYTKRAARVKYDTLGRISPELQVLFWTPAAGFFVVIVPSFNSMEATLEVWKDVENKTGFPITVEVFTNGEKNPKATKPEESEWTTYAIKGALATDPRAQEMMNAWRELQSKPDGKLQIAKTVLRFHKGEDYKGLPVEQLATMLNKYSALK